MHPTIQIELTHESLSHNEKAHSSVLNDQQRALISEFETCCFKPNWRHEHVELNGSSIDAFIHEHDGQQFIAAKTTAKVSRGGKVRDVDHYVVGQVSDGGFETAIFRRQIAQRLCMQAHAVTMNAETVAGFE